MGAEATRSFELPLLHSAHRAWLLLAGGAGIGVIAMVDWKVEPNLSLGFLYFLPILLLAPNLNTFPLLAVCAGCAVLRETLSPLPFEAGSFARAFMALASFLGGGLVVRELARNRQRAVENAAQLQEQVEGRREAEEELRVLVESSPAAILTAGSDGRIMQANGAARRLLGTSDDALPGEPLAAFLPALASVLDRPGPQFRTNLECMGRRGDGSVFLAHVWFSSYQTRTGPRLAAIVLDATEQFRDREASGLDAAAATSRILFGAVSHEVRNLSAAASVAHANLGRNAGLAANADYQALGALVDGLQRIASSELRLSSPRTSGAVDLATVLDELRIVVEPSLRESGVRFEVDVPADLPRVVGEPHSLLQILLNLAQNSQRALADAGDKRLLVRAAADGESVTVRFVDTGPGVPDPGRLFRPFQPGGEASGLGLFVSRTIARSFAGDLRYEPLPEGSCFALRLLCRREP